jgi:hypothetical protein
VREVERARLLLQYQAGKSPSGHPESVEHQPGHDLPLRS